MLNVIQQYFIIKKFHSKKNKTEHLLSEKVKYVKQDEFFLTTKQILLLYVQKIH